MNLHKERFHVFNLLIYFWVPRVENMSDSAVAKPGDDSSSRIHRLFDLEGGGITNCHKADVSSSALINLSVPPSRSSASTHFILIPANQR